MQESHSPEFKWSWNDGYLRWICGYANTDGGTIYIGVNDDGYVVGLENTKALAETLPNKITSKLGIPADIEICTARRGTNIRYGRDVPKDISEKPINRYV